MSTPSEPGPYPHIDALLAEAGWVMALAQRLARDQAAAEDIAQSTLALALERRPALGQGLRPWLGKVVGRLARRSVRGEVRRQDRELRVGADRGASEGGRSDEVLERFELQQDLARRVGELPEPYRTVLVRRYYEGLDAAQIAEASGASPATVRSQLARGLERLRLQYDQGGPGAQGGRGALGVFLFAAGAAPDVVSKQVLPRAAEILVMQTSTKVAIASFALVAAAAVALLIPKGGGPEWEAELGGRGTAREQVAVADKEEAQQESSQVPGGAERTAVAAVSEPSSPALSSAPKEASRSVSIVRARILGANGAPLPGATLSSVHPDGKERGPELIAPANAQGDAVLELKDGDLRRSQNNVFDMLFAVSGPGSATEFVVRKPVLHGDSDLGEFMLDPGAVAMGMTVDGDGRAIEGAMLIAGAGGPAGDPETRRLQGPKSGVARPHGISAADGSFAIPGIRALGPGGVPQGVRVWAYARGRFWASTDSLPIQPGESLDVGSLVMESVPSELFIEGKVMRPDGLAAGGARIDFLASGPPYGGHVLADAQGRFLILPKKDAAFEILARDGQGRFGMSATRVATRGDYVDLELQSRRVLTVAVVDPNGLPLHDASVRAVLADGPDFDGHGRLVPGDRWGETDALGQVEIEVPGQTFVIWVRMWGREEERLGPIEPDEAEGVLNVVMSDGRQVTGTVLAYGEPVEGAKVAAMRRIQSFVGMAGGFPHRYRDAPPTVTTDAEGRFTAPLNRDWTRIGVVARHAGMAAGEVTLDLEPGESASDVEIELTGGGAIEGAVTPPPGMTAPGLYVGASRGDGLAISTRVGTNGRYRFEGLTPGPWRVEGRRRELRTQTVSASTHPSDLDPSWNATVVDGETTELDLDLGHLVDVMVRGELRIDGALPPAGWTVQVVPPRHLEGPRERPAVELESGGSFAVAAGPGRADLVLRGPLPGGGTVEMLREVRVEGKPIEWKANLTTAPVDEWLDASHGEPDTARFVRGVLDRGEREVTLVPVNADGVVQVRVPVGESLLLVPSPDPESRTGWDEVRSVWVR